MSSAELTSRSFKHFGGQAVGSMPKEWTNEKHNFYLDSMEATFVRRLSNREYYSGNLLQPTNQFKVLQNGCWKKINFEPALPKPSTVVDSRVLMENPWVRHLRCAGKRQRLKEDDAYSSESIGPGGQKLKNEGAAEMHTATSNEVTVCSRKIHSGYSHERDRNYVSNDTEVTDQNFVDKDDEIHEENHRRNRFRGKKIKMASVDVLTRDEVVPLRNFSITEDSNENQAFQAY